MPSFDQAVTQWMSHGTVSSPNALNSSQVHSRGVATIPSIRSFQSWSATCGVGPAVSTGNPGS